MPNPSESLDQVSLYHYIRFTGVVCWCLFEVDFGVLGGSGSGFVGCLGGSRASWAASWGHLGSKMAPRRILAKIWPRFGSQVGAKLGPSWSQVGAKRLPGRLRERFFGSSKQCLNIKSSWTPCWVDFWSVLGSPGYAKIWFSY